MTIATPRDAPFCIVNNSANDISTISIEELDRDGNGLGSAPLACQYQVQVLSRRHGDKQIPLKGYSRTHHCRITAVFVNGDVITHDHGIATPIRVSSQREIQGPNSDRYRLAAQVDGGKLVCTLYDAVSTKSWMSNISDKSSLDQLSIPGTHETCALYGGDLVECQSMSLSDQLNAGIRFIDIRCVIDSNKFAIYHGIISQQLEFASGVMNVCLNFLENNPTECIVMSIKKERTSDSDALFLQIFNSYISNCAQQWYLNSTIPAIGTVRGKIVLFRRFSAPGQSLGINACPSQWGHNATFQISNSNANLYVQDQFVVDTVCNISDKWAAISNLLRLAQDDTSSCWYINFTSGTSTGAYPYTVAKGSPDIDGGNTRLYDYLSGQVSNKVGTILMDFPEYPDNGLITQLINFNIYGQTGVWNKDTLITNVGMTASPAAVEFNNQLYVFHQGFYNSGELWYIVSSDGVNWAPDKKISNVSMTESPSAVVFNNQLYVFHQGVYGTGTLWYSVSSDGVNWTPDKQIGNAGMSESPSAVVFNNELYVFYQGINHNGALLYSTSSDGNNWFADSIGNAGMSSSPSAVVFNNQLFNMLYVFYQGLGNAGTLYYSSLGIAGDWNANILINNVGITNSPAAKFDLRFLY